MVIFFAALLCMFAGIALNFSPAEANQWINGKLTQLMARDDVKRMVINYKAAPSIVMSHATLLSATCLLAFYPAVIIWFLMWPGYTNIAIIVLLAYPWYDLASKEITSYE